MEKSHIYNLGLVLGLTQPKVKTLIESATVLDNVIAAWKKDNVKEKGAPSWTVLISALKHHRVRIADVNAKATTEYSSLGLNLKAVHAWWLVCQLFSYLVLEVRLDNVSMKHPHFGAQWILTSLFNSNFGSIYIASCRAGAHIIGFFHGLSAEHF